MASGTGLGGLIPMVMTLAGIVTMVRARARRKRGDTTPPDPDFERRQAATRESERRMASYLAGRSLGPQDTLSEQDNEEIRR